MFVDLFINHELWDLACDIAIESTILDLGLKNISLPNDQEKINEISKFKKAVNIITAEKVYRYLQEGNISEIKLAYYEALFKQDDHEIWYLREAFNEFINDSDGDGSSDQDGKSSSDQGGNDTTNAMGSSARNTLEETWKNISEHMQMDLEHFSKNIGDTAGNLIQNLTALNREKYDYTSFLKKFAVMGEVMKINDDEFDYIFYTYGLKLYEKMPLIEPLEYKEEKRIKEFVIAIDTSGSVSGDLVQKFLNKTYNILKSVESFFTKINVHIIQCDTVIQEDVKITSQEEFDEYLKTMVLKGFGGTDFRPVFSYVDELIQQKEFSNLKGLIYFTDGMGVFPMRKPDYHTAFVYIDDEYNNYDVPSWAIKLILESEDIKKF